MLDTKTPLPCVVEAGRAEVVVFAVVGGSDIVEKAVGSGPGSKRKSLNVKPGASGVAGSGPRVEPGAREQRSAEVVGVSEAGRLSDAEEVGTLLSSFCSSNSYSWAPLAAVLALTTAVDPAAMGRRAPDGTRTRPPPTPATTTAPTTAVTVSPSLTWITSGVAVGAGV